MIELIRTYHEHYTSGIMTMPDGTQLYTLEPPWMDNMIGESCIDDGIYVLDRDKTGRFKYYRFRDEEVDPRFDIEIHPGNKIEHTEGCILLGLEINHPKSKYDDVTLYRSTEACDILLKWFGDDSLVINIKEG